jgi:hypothetical protein
MGNIALNKTATASNSVLPYAPSRAVDGTTTPFSRWLTNTVPAWLCVYMGGPSWINRWVVKHLPIIPNLANGWYPRYFANSEFVLQGSNDNVTWTTLDGISGNISTTVDRTLSSACCYVLYRVVVTKGLNINPKIASIVELELYAAPPTSSLLSGLATSVGALVPDFGKTQQAYTVSVANDVTSLTVTPTAEDIKATIKVNGVAVISGTASGSIPLKPGPNIISVSVAAQIGGTMTVYTITATRQDSNYLTALAVQPGTLTPAFAKATNGYTVAADAGTSSIIITPTAESTRAIITVNGIAVTSGSASGPVALTGASTAIPVVVTTDGVARTYTVTVNRAASAYLSALTAQSGATSVVLSPTPFVKTIMGYSASVMNTVSSISITPTAESSTATITVNGTAVVSGQASGAISLNVGANTIPVVVTSGGVTQNYSVTITRAAAPVENAYLSALTAQSGAIGIALSPTPFVKTTMGYTALVDSDVDSLTVTPTAESATAAITVKGIPVSSGQASASIPLSFGANNIPVVVTAGGTTQTYTIVVTRQTSAYLTGIGLIIGKVSYYLVPVFVKTKYDGYSVAITSSPVSMVPAREDPNATLYVTCNGTEVTGSSGSYSLSIVSGANTVVIRVTSTSMDVKTYMFTIQD